MRYIGRCKHVCRQLHEPSFCVTPRKANCDSTCANQADGPAVQKVGSLSDTASTVDMFVTIRCNLSGSPMKP